ncbi:molybdate ABC transporter permease subunit [Komagataeibacter swingsii]|uniref:Molybdenum transport system permease n=1 Tax=Komagataeibacter swingsii TaxID=215220 RepID=A0A850P2S1_9PROT|nr:molybdate ABC transporter permease subunit [Komagataeibacter swingsii]NVN38248.1 molybdate ABC transporter permease subunit [Komagataeibacter swingsii]
MKGIPTDIMEATILTLELAVVTTGMLVTIALPLAWWLAFPQRWWKSMVNAIISLPLVLPPSVLGYYLLLAFGPTGPGGWIARLWGARTLAFSFHGLVIGSLLYALPFAVQPIQNAFHAMGRHPVESAAVLGASPWRIFYRIAIPMAWRGVVTAIVLSFAHTIGEFGIVLMIGGDIPGQTRVLSVALYDYVESARWHDANMIAGGMVMFSFLTILLLSSLQNRKRRHTS